MSATIPNLELLGKWLQARVYHTDYRPIQLTQTLSIGSKLHQPTTMAVVSELPTDLKIKDDLDNFIGYCLETILDGNGVLLFCASKAACEKAAESVGRFMRSVLTGAESALKRRLCAVINASRQREFVDQFRKTAPKMDSLLAKTLLYGVAFHHAGLVMEEREAVERGFRQGAVRMIAATSTLSAGVNLPARRVIVRSPWGHPNRPGPYLSSAVYLQMIGRAGRKGIDEKGR
uniref:Helicase C-terminal domain-containing protein n=1 Tax=Plectus sambesii TaxID=2011161 RepID=A0A914VPK2_9BILA